jgi:hypothetical protein
LPCILINCAEHRYLLTCLTLFHIFIHINNVQINPSKYIHITVLTFRVHVVRFCLHRIDTTYAPR